MTFGERLTELRKSKHWSQDALAEMLGVSRQSVSKWETGTSVPDLDKLVRLSDLFGVTLDELVRGAPAAQTAANSSTGSLLAKAAALYQEKAYLLGWLLILGSLHRASTALNALQNYYAQTDWAATLRFFNIAVLPNAITIFAMLLTGILFLSAGRSFSGRYRWYHLGWVFLLSAVFGLRLIPPFHTGLLESFLTSIWLLPRHGGINVFSDVLPDLFMNFHLLLLLAFGFLLLWGGKRCGTKRTPE